MWTTEEFAEAVRDSDNYYVLITRESLYNLPYSVEEIYGLHASGRYQNTKKTYQQMYRIYTEEKRLPVKPGKIIVEQLKKKIFQILVLSRMAQQSDRNESVTCTGRAEENIDLYLPESFEWMLLQSGLFEEKDSILKAKTSIGFKHEG